MFKTLGLRNRMLISICSVALIAFSITIAYVATQFSGKVKVDALLLSEEMAFRYGAVVTSKLEVAMDAARTLAHSFEGIKISGETNRKLMNDIQKQILERNPNFLGVWTCWEPDALDGKDKEFAHTEGHDATGRFVPYWYRSSGKINMEPLVGYDVAGDGDYYLAAKTTGMETILDPYKYQINGKEVLLTSLVVPIKVDGKVLGVAGIDISLAELVDLIAPVKPFGSGYGYIVSNNATITAHHKQKIVGEDLIPRQRPDVQRQMAEAIKNGNKYSLTKLSKATGIISYQVFTPITIGHTATPWSFVISVPMQTIMSAAQRAMYTSIGIGIAAIAALILVVFFIAKGIADPMNNIIGSLDDAAAQVSSACGQVAASSQQLAEGSSEQAASIEETSASLEEMSSMTQQNAKSANLADKLTKEANQVVSQANESMNELTLSMEEISNASEETSKIIKTIDEIAFQTNLLALNAAVEAARAGEAGAGFAVVADEVRNLAMRAADAAKNTAALIEETAKKVNDGSNIVTRTSDAFDKVAGSAGRVGELVAEISTASKEQAQGIEQVNTAVTEMDKVTQQNAANAEESASASEEMSAQAKQMKAMVNELLALVKGRQKQSTISRTPNVGHTRPDVVKPVPAVKASSGKLPKQIIPIDHTESFGNF